MMVVGHVRQVHPRAADRGARDGRCVAPGRAHDHSVPCQPHSEGARRSARQSPAAGRDHRRIHRFYQPLLHRALARPKLTVWGSLAACVVIMVGVGGVIGFSLFPKADTPHFLVTVETPDGSSLAETDRALRFVEDKLQQLPEVDVVLHQSRPRQPEDLLQRDPATRATAIYGDVFVQAARVTTRARRRACSMSCAAAQAVSECAHLRERVPERPADHGADRRARHRYRISIELYELAGRVEKIIKETPGTRDVENPMRMRRTNLQSRSRLAEGGAARRAGSRVRSRGASGRRRHPGGAFQGHRTASSTTSWCARRSKRVPTYARSTRCASPR